MTTRFTSFLGAFALSILTATSLPVQGQNRNPLDILKGAIKGKPSIDLKKEAENFLIKQLGEALGVGSPLLLDQHTAYENAPEQADFQPIVLHPVTPQDLLKPLPPGDYAIDVTAFCTQYSIRAGTWTALQVGSIEGKTGSRNQRPDRSRYASTYFAAYS